VLGSVTLHPHQRSAVARLSAAIDQFNGALLCDDVGMGKTYVALAISRRFARTLVVAPAALTAMWRAAFATTRTEASIITFESLSRADTNERRGRAGHRATWDFIVVDEAHHVRNPRTNRYFALESHVRGAKVLLLSATPIHNRRQDLVALLALFLGSRAHTMTSAELVLCVVRRDHHRLELSSHIPVVLPVVNHETSDDPALVAELMELPPPIPVRDGGVGGTLIGRGLVHQWASSAAALREAICRRIGRAAALCASLEAGTYPTASELETWIYGEGALQLGFAELLSAPIAEHEELLTTIRVHMNALEEIRTRLSSPSAKDAERAQIVGGVRASNRGGKLVAFAQYAETISMLFRMLARTGRVAMLTSHGARVAGGPLTRIEAITRFAPQATGCAKPAAAEEIDLLLTTDLLSEGVNLQDANVVMHLDIPWTVARMEQRVGRVARLGSRHSKVSVHALRPPPSAAEVLRSESIIQSKWRLARSAVGTSARNPAFRPVPAGDASEPDNLSTSTPDKAERLRTILESWISPENEAPSDEANEFTLIASVDADAPGFVAAVSAQGNRHLLIGLADRITTDLAAQIEVCGEFGSTEIATDPASAQRAMEMIHDWLTSEMASAAAGLGASNALRRRQITSRIDALIESAPPHLRTSRLIAAARARAVATTSQCAAVEHELEALLASDLPPDEWLRAIADLESNAGRLNASSADPPKIHAILILDQRS
jgi:superfamily II DNA or RNA helicase